MDAEDYEILGNLFVDAFEGDVLEPFCERTGLDKVLGALREQKNIQTSANIVSIFQQRQEKAIANLLKAVLEHHYYEKFLITLAINKEEAKWNCFDKPGIFHIKEMDQWGIINGHYAYKLNPLYYRETRVTRVISSDGKKSLHIDRVKQSFTFTEEEKQKVLEKILEKLDWLRTHLVFTQIDEPVYYKFGSKKEYGFRPGLLKKVDEEGLIYSVEFNPELFDRVGIKPFPKMPSRDYPDRENFLVELLELHNHFVIYSGLVEPPPLYDRIDRWLIARGEY